MMQLCPNCGSDELILLDPIPLLDPLTDPIRYRYEYRCNFCGDVCTEEELQELNQKLESDGAYLAGVWAEE